MVVHGMKKLAPKQPNTVIYMLCNGVTEMVVHGMNVPVQVPHTVAT